MIQVKGVKGVKEGQGVGKPLDDIVSQPMIYILSLCEVLSHCVSY